MLKGMLNLRGLCALETGVERCFAAAMLAIARYPAGTLRLPSPGKKKNSVVFDVRINNFHSLKRGARIALLQLQFGPSSSKIWTSPPATYSGISLTRDASRDPIAGFQRFLYASRINWRQGNTI